MTAHKLTPQDKRLREHIVSIAALLGRRQSLERWLKVGLESKTRLPDVFFISDEQWKRIAENKAVPDKARVYVGIAIEGYFKNRSRPDLGPKFREQQRLAKSIRKTIERAAYLIGIYERGHSWASEGSWASKVNARHYQEVRVAQMQLAEMAEFFRMAGFGDRPGAEEQYALPSLVFDLDTIVRHFRDGKGLGLTGEDCAFVSAVCSIAEPKRPLSSTTVQNLIRKVQGLIDSFVKQARKIAEDMPDQGRITKDADDTPTEETPL